MQDKLCKISSIQGAEDDVNLASFKISKRL